jgi:hypothetical protein
MIYNFIFKIFTGVCWERTYRESSSRKATSFLLSMIWSLFSSFEFTFWVRGGLEAEGNHQQGQFSPLDTSLCSFAMQAVGPWVCAQCTCTRCLGWSLGMVPLSLLSIGMDQGKRFGKHLDGASCTSQAFYRKEGHHQQTSADKRSGLTQPTVMDGGSTNK